MSEALLLNLGIVICSRGDTESPESTFLVLGAIFTRGLVRSASFSTEVTVAPNRAELVRLALCVGS